MPNVTDDLRCVKVYPDDSTSKSKRPIGDGWQTKLFPYAEAMTWDITKCNVGLKLGIDSGNVFSVDCDGPNLGLCLLKLCTDWETYYSEDGPLKEFIRKFQYTTRFQSSPNRHQFLLKIDFGETESKPMAKRKIFVTKFDDLVDQTMCIELLANGQQTVIPPSICSKEGKYEHFKRVYEKDISILETFTIEEFEAGWAFFKSECEEQVKIKCATPIPESIYAAADCDMKSMIKTIEESGAFDAGSRHDFVMCFCALMMEFGITKETTSEIVQNLCSAYGGDWNDLELCINYSYAKRYYRPTMITLLEKMMK